MRELAVQLAEDEVISKATSAKLSTNVTAGFNSQAVNTTSGVKEHLKSMVSALMKSQEALVSQHAELLKHLSEETPKHKTMGKGKRGSIVCWHCQKVGHTQRKSFLLKSGVKKTDQAVDGTSNPGHGSVPLTRK